MTFVIVLALFGFPIALVLAWAFEVTPAGVKRTEDASPGELTQIIEAPVSARWPAGLLALVGVVALVWGAWLIGKRAGVSEAEDSATISGPAAGVELAYAELSNDTRPSIAVLPFADMSREGDQEYFSDGITEEILNVLARIPELRVAARTTAFSYKGQDPDLREVGEDLGVRYVLEGSVRKADQDLRITAQLIDTRDNFHVWSESYDRTLDNVFEIQTEIAEAIAGALRVPLGVAEKSELVIPTGDMAAYDLYLEAGALVRDRGPENIANAIALYEAAIARDSGWAPAWAGLALTRTLEPYYQASGKFGPTTSPEEWDRSLSAAEVAADRALALDPNNATARVALGTAYRDRWRWNEAEAEFRRALEADPDNVEAHQQYAELLNSVGRSGEALNSSARALALDRSPIRLAIYAVQAAANGRYEEALEIAREGVARDPGGNVDLLSAVLLESNIRLGNYDAAEQLVRSGRWGRREYPAIIQALKSGDPADAAEIGDPIERAYVLMRQGREDLALQALDGYRIDPPFRGRAWLFQPEFDPIRVDPRFQAILAQMGLEGVEPEPAAGS